MTRNWGRTAVLPLALAIASISAHADTFVAKDIRLEGLGRLSASSVYALLPFAAGETISEERSADLVRALFASGQFEDVQALREGDALVVRVVERARDTLVGDLRASRRGYVVVPDDPRISREIIVRDPARAGLTPAPKPGDKVVVRLDAIEAAPSVGDDDVVFVDAIPLGATGKMLKTKLREQLTDYRLPGL